jgi:predicted lactoylglutathione lyase
MAILVNIDVPNLAKGIEFYSAAIGMKLLRLVDEDVAELGRDEDRFYLLQKKEFTSFASTATSFRTYTRHWTPVHIDFVVDNLDEAKERAIGAGATCECDCIEWRGSKCITFADPFGHGFCLIEFSGQSYTK